MSGAWNQECAKIRGRKWDLSSPHPSLCPGSHQVHRPLLANMLSHAPRKRSGDKMHCWSLTGHAVVQAFSRPSRHQSLAEGTQGRQWPQDGTAWVCRSTRGLSNTESSHHWLRKDFSNATASTPREGEVPFVLHHLVLKDSLQSISRFTEHGPVSVLVRDQWLAL